MKKPHSPRALTALFLVIASSAAGCSAGTSEVSAAGEPGEEAADESEIRAKKECSPETYQKAFDRYHAAVEGAKAHLRDGPCGVGAFTYEIIQNLHASVTTCHQFRDVIKTSKWAKPVREVLQTNLALPALTGELASDLSNLAAELPGTVIYAPGGSMGPVSTIAFAADGRANDRRLEWSEEENRPTFPQRSLQWRVHADAVVLVVDGDETVFEVKFTTDEFGPHFSFEPAPPMLEGTPTYTNAPSECDA